ncbi:glycosyltransferase family 4 protein [Deinococcus sp. KSM4-11]|uniref:glycosyltransferase family 4 protein n=1 Tax=Deinococcus sp. KSM4-11 TaxID=2568654 RepID=UPI001454B9BC|nr:glycosyltransferase family 4 protein [Deinococcus sp. KSM4-11]
MTGRGLPTPLLSCYACAPATGTEPGFGWYTATYLAEAGLNVHVLTRPGNRPAIEASHRDRQGNLNVTFYYVDLPLLFRPLRETTGLHYLLWQLAALRVARGLTRRVPIDVVHHLTYGSVQGGSLLWALNRPFVFGPAGGGQTAPPLARRYFGRAWRTERLRTLLSRLVVLSPLHRLMARGTAVMCATNRQTADLLTRLGAKRVRMVLDSGLPDDLIAGQVPARGGDTLNVLWVGRLLKRKALRLALESVAALEVPVHLTVVGDGPDGALLDGWIEELGLQGKVSALGRIPWLDVMNLYREQDVFLFTSLRDSFGSQLLEAAAQGLPIVCLDHQGAGDVLPAEAAFKVPLRTEATLATDVAAALRRFAELGLPAREQMGRAALTFARQHTWAAKAAGYLQLYQEIRVP